MMMGGRLEANVEEDLFKVSGEHCTPVYMYTYTHTLASYGLCTPVFMYIHTHTRWRHMDFAHLYTCTYTHTHMLASYGLPMLFFYCSHNFLCIGKPGL